MPSQCVSRPDDAEVLIAKGWTYVGTLPNDKTVTQKRTKNEI